MYGSHRNLSYQYQRLIHAVVAGELLPLEFFYPGAVFQISYNSYDSSDQVYDGDRTMDILSCV
jgi:hypothetical protein